MNAKSKSMLALLMGVIIIIADVYWTWTSYYSVVWLGLGAIIFMASVIWMLIDYSFMKK